MLIRMEQGSYEISPAESEKKLILVEGLMRVIVEKLRCEKFEQNRK